MNIGVAIVTHNNSQDIATCVASVLKEGLQTIVLVDSASHDDTTHVLSRLGFPYEGIDTNKGFGYAANKAAAKLNTEYVLFLNPDSYVQPGAIQSLMRTIHAHPTAGVIGMLLCDSHGTPERMACGSEPTLRTLFMRRIIRKRIAPAPFLVDWVSGGALVIRKRIFDEVGGFDEGFFLYWEDVDLCKRVRDLGYSIYMDSTAKVTHMRGGSKLDNTEKTKIYSQSADRYFKKHYSTTIWRIQRLLRRIYRPYIA